MRRGRSSFARIFGPAGVVALVGRAKRRFADGNAVFADDMRDEILITPKQTRENGEQRRRRLCAPPDAPTNKRCTRPSRPPAGFTPTLRSLIPCGMISTFARLMEIACADLDVGDYGARIGENMRAFRENFVLAQNRRLDMLGQIIRPRQPVGLERQRQLVGRVEADDDRRARQAQADESFKVGNRR